MKKLLLTGIAALSVHCASAAHAADQLPGYMLGRWCYSNASTKTQEVYFRPNLIDPERSTCSDLTDGIMLSQEGYEDETASDTNSSCVFDKIEQKEEDIYLAHAHCTDVDADDQSDFKGYEEFKLINGLLFKKRIPEG